MTQSQLLDYQITQIPDSDLYGRPVRSVSRLANGLRHRGVRVNRANQFLDCRLETQGQRRLCHELGGAQADHMDAEDFVVLPVRNDLDESFGLPRPLGT